MKLIFAVSYVPWTMDLTRCKSITDDASSLSLELCKRNQALWSLAILTSKSFGELSNVKSYSPLALL